MTLNEQTAPIDPWVASSLLQKAIRRGEVDHALHAARTLYRQRGTGIWRRFIVIACEDIGIGDLDLVRHVTMLGIDRNARRPFGTDAEIIADLVQRLAEAPKDRSTDYLICAAIEHPDYEQDREAIAALPTNEQIAVALAPHETVVRRAIAMWYAAGVNAGGQQVLGPGDLPQLLHGFDQLGFPHPLSSIIETAARKTKEPIVVMIPLLWALAREGGGIAGVEDIPLAPAPTCRGIPAWTFDKHTRLGKRAMRQFIREAPAVDAVLSAYVCDFRAQAVLEIACFYADAIPINRRLIWKHSYELEALGLEVDMMAAGCPRQGMQPILDTVRANLDRLNMIRCRLFSGQCHAKLGA